MPTSKETFNTARMARMLNITVQRIGQLAKENLVPSPVDGEWHVDAVVRAYVSWRLDHLTEGAKADKARKEKADADIAETKSAKLYEVLVYKDDYMNNLSDAIAIGVSLISRIKSLSTSQKEEVFAALRSVKMPDLDKSGQHEEETDETDETR